MTLTTILVIAKAPVPGRVKTRLCPPCTPEEAASLAEGALIDTLNTAINTPADHHVIALDGYPGEWLPSGFQIFAQRGDGLDERLAAAFADVFATEAEAQRVVLIGMDTPQITTQDLIAARDMLATHDAVIGLAEDGGWWCIGLQARNDDVFIGVPMSLETTGVQQLRRLSHHKLSVAHLRKLRDVDTFTDAVAVACENDAVGCAQTRVFAQRVEEVNHRVTTELAKETQSR